MLIASETLSSLYKDIDERTMISGLVLCKDVCNCYTFVNLRVVELTES